MVHVELRRCFNFLWRMKCTGMKSMTLSDGEYYEMVKSNFERADRLTTVRTVTNYTTSMVDKLHCYRDLLFNWTGISCHMWDADFWTFGRYISHLPVLCTHIFFLTEFPGSSTRSHRTRTLNERGASRYFAFDLDHLQFLLN